MALEDTKMEATAEIGTSDNNIVKNIEMKMNGFLVEAIVNVNLLREVLGLPLHDEFNAGAHDGCTHNETFGPDVEDTNHVALSLV